MRNIKYALILLINFLPTSLFGASEISFELGSFTSGLYGEDKASGNSDTYESEAQLVAGLSYKWLLASRVHLLFTFKQERHNYAVDDAFFVGDSEFSLNELGVGVRLVLSPKMAFSLSSFNKEIIVIDRPTNTTAELISEDINFLKIEYNQVFLQFRPFNLGMNLFYDLDGSANKVVSRSGFGGKFYSVIGRGANRLRIYIGLDSIKKETDDLEITQKNNYGGLEYIYRFK